MKGMILAAIAAAGMLAFAAPAIAVPMYPMTLSESGNFNDGGTFSGVIFLNQYGYETGFDITTTAGSILPGSHYSNTLAANYASNTLSMFEVDPLYQNTFKLTFQTPLYSLLGTIDPIVAGFPNSGECQNSYSCYQFTGGPSRFVTSGIAQVPEPLTLSLLATGLAGLALTRRRKKVATA